MQGPLNILLQSDTSYRSGDISEACQRMPEVRIRENFAARDRLVEDADF